MDIHSQDTVETLSPVRRAGTPLLSYLAVIVVLGIAAAAVFALSSPAVRARLMGSHVPQVELSVTSTPEGSDVFIDDRGVGSTPVRVRVPVGQHRVRIVRRDYEPWHQVVETNRAVEVAAALKPLKLALLRIDSHPDGAGVFLDDEYRGTAPIEIPDIEAGHHVVRVAKEPLYQTVVKQVELQAGETRRMAVTLPSGLESLYIERIKKAPNKLSNYTELLHLHVIEGNVAKALATVNQALDALKAADADPAEIRQFYDELHKLLKSGDETVDAAAREKLLGTVLLLFEKLALSKPTAYTYYQPLVSVLGQAGRYDDIVKVCEKSVSNPQARGYVHYYVAKLYLSWGSPARAISLLERTVELRPTMFSAQLQLGSAYHRAERYDDAMRQYQAAEKLGSSTSAYYRGYLQTHIARLLVARGDVKGAIARYKKALEEKVATSYACTWRLEFASMLLEHKLKDEAIVQYREVQRLAPTSKIGYAARKALRRLGTK